MSSFSFPPLFSHLIRAGHQQSRSAAVALWNVSEASSEMVTRQQHSTFEAAMVPAFAIGFLALCAVGFVMYVFFLIGQHKLQDELAKQFRK